MCWRWSSNYKDWKVGIPLTGLTPPLFSSWSKSKTWIYNVICRGLFCVQRAQVRCDCLFFWYWWNRCSSLLSLSFHSKVAFTVQRIKIKNKIIESRRKKDKDKIKIIQACLVLLIIQTKTVHQSFVIDIVTLLTITVFL